MVSILIVGCSSSKSSSSSEDKASVAISNDNSGLSENSVAGTNGDAQKINDAKAVNESKDALVNSLEGQGKIIRNGIIQMETLSFDEAVKEILSKTNSMGAYVQSSNVAGTSIEAKLSQQSRKGDLY